VPVTAASQRHNVVRLDYSHDIIITAEPIITRSVHPPDVMSTISRSTLVRNTANQLIVPRIETLAMWTVQLLIVLLYLVLLKSKFSCHTGQFGFILLGFFILRLFFHYDILVFVRQISIVFFFSLLGLKFTTTVK